MSKYKKNLVALTAKLIAYYPVYRNIYGEGKTIGVTSAILFQQMEYRFSLTDGEKFYKFLESCNQPAYKEGDSWIEEVGMSKDEFRTAFDAIGRRHFSCSKYLKEAAKGEQFKIKEGEEFVEKMYLSFHNKITGLTWYERNHNFVHNLISQLAKKKELTVNGLSRSTEIEKNNLRKSGKSIPNNRDTETYSEKTTTIENKLVVSFGKKDEDKLREIHAKSLFSRVNLEPYIRQGIGHADLARILDYLEDSYSLPGKEPIKVPAAVLKGAIRNEIKIPEDYILRCDRITHEEERLRKEKEAEAEKRASEAKTEAEWERIEAAWEVLSAAEKKALEEEARANISSTLKGVTRGSAFKSYANSSR